MANGLLIWPILVSLAFCFALPRRIWVTLLVCGAGTWIAYFTGYIRPADHPSPVTALLHLPAFFRFGVTVLGSPFADVIAKFGASGRPGFVEDTAAAIGVAGLLAGLTESVLRFGRKTREKSVSRAELVYWHLLLFVLLSVSLIASGRYTFPVSEALTSRYTTPGLLFWLFLGILLLVSALRSPSPRIRMAGRCLQLTACLAFLLFVYCDRPAKLAYARGYQQYLSEAEVAIADNVFDEQAWKRVNHDMTSLLPIADFVRARNLSLFHKPWRLWIGDSLGKHVTISAAGQCIGSVDVVRPVSTRDRPGYRIEGWVWATRKHSIPHDLVLTDGNGKVIGSGLSGFPRPDVSVSLHNARVTDAGWIGYISGLNHRDLRAYVLLRGTNDACLVGSHSIVAVNVDR